MIELDIFRRLIEKYRFSDYIPADVQKFVLTSKKHVLISSLKSLNELNLFYRFAISIYYSVRLIGYKPSIAISKLIALGSALLVSGVLVTGIAFAAKKFVLQKFSNKSSILESLTKDKISNNIESDAIDEKEAKPNTDKDIIGGANPVSPLKAEADHNKENKSDSSLKVRLGIDNVLSSDEDKQIAGEVTKLLYENLKDLKGDSGVIYVSKNRDEKSVNRHLLGRLSKVGKAYILSVNIVNTQTGDVLYSKTSTYNSPEDSGKVIRVIAEEINNKSSMWK